MCSYYDIEAAGLDPSECSGCICLDCASRLCDKGCPYYAEKWATIYPQIATLRAEG